MSDNIPTSEVKKWWFCWKQKGGQWRNNGPFATEIDASAAREKSKVSDAEWGNVFYSTRSEAEDRCNSEATG